LLAAFRHLKDFPRLFFYNYNNSSGLKLQALLILGLQAEYHERFLQATGKLKQQVLLELFGPSHTLPQIVLTR
jgi:hypothetical protein